LTAAARFEYATRGVVWDGPAPSKERGLDRSRAQLALAVLFAINLMNFLDRQILGAVGEDIR
jgi:hypothetical protein